VWVTIVGPTTQTCRKQCKRSSSGDSWRCSSAQASFRRYLGHRVGASLGDDPFLDGSTCSSQQWLLALGSKRCNPRKAADVQDRHAWESCRCRREATRLRGCAPAQSGDFLWLPVSSLRVSARGRARRLAALSPVRKGHDPGTSTYTALPRFHSARRRRARGLSRHGQGSASGPRKHGARPRVDGIPYSQETP
jgi:hypothetical protein